MGKTSIAKDKPSVVAQGQLVPCTHGLAFDITKAQGMTAREIRLRWPRLFGKCPHCDYDGIAYATSAHYIMGDW